GYLWGIEEGNWNPPIKQPLDRGIGAMCEWLHSAPAISVKQVVEIVPGGLSDDGKNRLLDTCLVRYDIRNNDPTLPHRVGLRFMLDTFIGSTDAVPFTIAGEKELCGS